MWHTICMDDFSLFDGQENNEIEKRSIQSGCSTGKVRDLVGIIIHRVTYALYTTQSYVWIL